MDVKQEILKEIEELKILKNDKNNAIEATKNMALTTASKIQARFNQFSQTESIDERIQVLIEACREVVAYTEEFHNELEKEVQTVQMKIETLEDLLKKLEHHFDLSPVKMVQAEEVTEEDSEAEASEGEKK